MPKFWRFQNKTESSAELLLYGDISETSWWGDEVTPKQFAGDLAELGPVSEITVRINSGGGDVFAAQAIGNLLEANAAEVTAVIDGLCASAATIVACHCNKVVAAEDSTYMIHPAKMGLSGYYEANDLQNYVGALNTIRENIVTLYTKKTGREKDEVAAWMDATSWWTSAEAKENGFVDELTGNGETVVENRRGLLFVNSVNMHLPFDKAPAELQRKCARHTPPKDAGRTFVQNSVAAAPAASGFVNKDPGGASGENKEDFDMEIKTVDDLRQAYPDMIAQIKQAAAQEATETERQRIRDIEDMALPGSEDLTNEAKFEKPVSAEDYAKAAMKRAKAQGSAYLADSKKDAKNAGQVSGEPPKDGKPDEFMDAIKSVGKKQ